MPADGQERQAGDGSFSMSADVQDRRKIVQHALRCTKARQEMDHAACWQMDRGRAADGSYSMPADEQGQGSAGMDRKSRTGDGTGSRQTNRSRSGQIDSKGRQMMLHEATISDT